MIINLHGLIISLDSQDERVHQQWCTLFDYELTKQLQGTAAGDPDIIVKVKVLPTAPTPPAANPFYVSKYPPLDVYAHEGHIILIPYYQTLISLTLGSEDSRSGRSQHRADISITPFILESDGFEDVITLALAPFLRRRGFFMVHAFTTAVQQHAIMFSGPSGSGKTTAGLSLVSAGWQLLANDVALLCENGEIMAALSPGTVHAGPKTIALLPDLAKTFSGLPPHPYHGKVAVPRLALLNQTRIDLAVPLKVIYFPQIEENCRHQIIELPRAVGLARLMEASMDQWDQPAWDTHVDFLERLSHQVRFNKLILGSDLPSLPKLLQNDCQDS